MQSKNTELLKKHFSAKNLKNRQTDFYIATILYIKSTREVACSLGICGILYYTAS